MYDIQFVATDSSDWAEAVELIDAETNLPLDTEGATFELRVSDACNSSFLHASTDLGTIVQPEDHIVQWVFDHDAMGSLCSGNTYRVGLVMTVDGFETQLLLGTLTYLEGVV